MSRAGSLLQLQGIDLEMDVKRARLRAIEIALGDDPTVQMAQRDLVEAQGDLHSARVSIQNLEFDGQNLGQKIADVDSRMYSGKVTNPKELQDLQNEVNSLRHRRDALEEKQVEALLIAANAEVR